MASNGLSKRRGPLRRPKVCDTARNPGRCEPPPPPSDITCSVAKDEPTPIYTGEEFTFVWSACNPALSELPLLLPVVNALFGTIGNIDESENCSEGANIEYEAPDDPITDTITATFTWPDDSTCIAEVTFDVTEEDENGD